MIFLTLIKYLIYFIKILIHLIIKEREEFIYA